MTMASDAQAPRTGARTPAILRIGLRELRGGLKGFKIFIACLALGVMVIAAVGALGDALRAGFLKQGQSILGGDVTFMRSHTRATVAERAAFDRFGIEPVETVEDFLRKLADGSVGVGFLADDGLSLIHI